MSGNKFHYVLNVTVAWLMILLAQPVLAQLGTGVVFVDPSSGVDSPEQSGGTEGPFATITYAMQRLESAEVEKPWTLRLRAGTYASPAETFPIVLHTGMQLIGDAGEVPSSVIISGTGNANTNEPLVIANGATNVTVSGVTFRDHARTGGSHQGAAMELIAFGGSIENCRFIGNSSRKAGGAIWVSLATGAGLSLHDTLFEANKVAWSGDLLLSGGAFHVEGDYRGAVTDCVFLKNTIHNSTQTSNGNLYAAGGGLYVSGDFSASTFSNNTFTENKTAGGWSEWDNTSSGAAIHIEGNASTAVESCAFTGNMAYGSNSLGGALAVRGSFTASNGKGINDCTFTNNLARTSGGAIHILGEAQLLVSGSSFEENSVLGRGDLRTGGAVHIAGDFVGSIQESHFSTNTATNTTQSSSGLLFAAGGALYVGGDFRGGTVTESTFSGNELTPGWSEWENSSSGGAIHIEGNASISFESCAFSENSALGRNSTGGAVSVGGSFDAPEGEGFGACTFTKNVARTSGGAVGIQSFAQLTINESYFSENIVRGTGPLRSGGAMHVSGEFTGSILGSTFNANVADNLTQSTTGYLSAAGGALYVGGAHSGGTFADNNFTANELIPSSVGLSTNWTSGGAIHIKGRAATSFMRSGFTGNTANGAYATGGAIAILGDFESTEAGGLQQCIFVENHAAGPGGAVFAGATWSGAVLDSDFIRNTGRGSKLPEAEAAFGGALAISAAMQGDIRSCLFSDNQITRFLSGIRTTGGAVGVGGTFLGIVEYNSFTANSAVGGSGSWSEGGAIGIRGLVQPNSRIHNNLFSRNSANYGGGIYLGADNGVQARLFNNHFLYNQTPDNSTGGAAIFTRQNMFIYNNTIYGQSTNVAGITLWDLAGGTELWNNAIINVNIGVHLNSATLTNAVVFAHNNFFNTTNIVRRGSEGLGNQIQTIQALLGSKFFGNHIQDPLISGEGGDPSRPAQSGSWKSPAYYDTALDVTVFSDPEHAWTDGQWSNKLLNLSQSATDDNLREHYLIVNNTSTEIHVRGNLAPEVDGIVGDNRGGLGQTYTIDDYRLNPASPNIDRGAPVEVFVGGVRTTITPAVDYEADLRPRNCGVDIGADEGLRPVSPTLTLNGDATICLPVGTSFVDPGVTALYGNGVDIGTLVSVEGEVDTNTVGTYTVRYVLDFCVEPVITRTRTVEISSIPCGNPSGPVADAGVDRTVTADDNGAITLQLDASGSSGSGLSFVWTGLEAAPDPADTVMPTITLSEGVFTFELTVADSNGDSDSDQVTITVLGSSSTGPVANAGQNQTVSADNDGLAIVTLDARRSSGDGLRYEWQGLGGAPDPADTAMPTITLTPGSYRFQLTVTDDNALSDSATVTVTVLSAGTGTAPTAVASAEILQEIHSTNPLATVLLDGSASVAIRASISTHIWSGLEGAPDPTDSERATVELEPGTHTFRLTVIDSNGLSASDTVTITVRRPTLNTIQQILRSAFADADMNEDGTLSQGEARSIVPYLNNEEFANLDTNRDGELNVTELDPKSGNGIGCSVGIDSGDAGMLGDIMVILFALGLLGGSASSSKSQTGRVSRVLGR